MMSFFFCRGERKHALYSTPLLVLLGPHFMGVLCLITLVLSFYSRNMPQKSVVRNLCRPPPLTLYNNSEYGFLPDESSPSCRFFHIKENPSKQPNIYCVLIFVPVFVSLPASHQPNFANLERKTDQQMNTGQSSSEKMSW